VGGLIGEELVADAHMELFVEKIVATNLLNATVKELAQRSACHFYDYRLSYDFPTIMCWPLLATCSARSVHTGSPFSTFLTTKMSMSVPLQLYQPQTRALRRLSSAVAVSAWWMKHRLRLVGK
jgi:hypothetical protein